MMQQPTNPIWMLIFWLFFSVFVVFVSVANSTGMPPTPTENVQVPHTITSVTVGRYPSFAAYPAPLYIDVAGFQPDGCDFPVQIDQRREGTSVYVDIYRAMPANTVCTAIAKEYQTRIDLEGGFDKGTYTIIVNGFSVQYTP